MYNHPGSELYQFRFNSYKKERGYSPPAEAAAAKTQAEGLQYFLIQTAKRTSSKTSPEGERKVFFKWVTLNPETHCHRYHGRMITGAESLAVV